MPVCQLIINNRIPRKPYAPNEAPYGMAGKPFFARAQPSPSDGTSGMARADPRGTPHQLDFDCLCQFKIGDLTHPGCWSGGVPSGRMCRVAKAANEVGHLLEASIPGAPAGFDEFPPLEGAVT
jgi:hypothetical protein